MLPNEQTTRSEVVALPSEVEVLVAAPERNVARPLVAFLKAERVNVQLVLDVETAFEEAMLHRPNVILVDERISPSGGTDLVERLKANGRTHFLPTILVLNAHAPERRARAFQAGADAVFDDATDDREQRARLWALIRSQALYRRQEKKQKTQGSALQTRRRWVSGFVHDLQSSLGALQANFEYMAQAVLAREAKTNPELDECLRDAQSLFGQLTRGLRTVLDYERFESGRIVVREGSVLLSQLATDARRELEWQATTERKRLLVSGAPTEVPVRGDRSLLKDAIQNLMAFALRQPQTRLVSVAVEPTRSEEGDRVMRLRVGWDGERLAPTDREVLFEPYAPMHVPSTPVGHGLGLALAKVVTEVHDGGLWVEDAPGTGTAVVMELKVDGVSPDLRASE